MWQLVGWLLYEDIKVDKVKRLLTLLREFFRKEKEEIVALIVVVMLPLLLLLLAFQDKEGK